MTHLLFATEADLIRLLAAHPEYLGVEWHEWQECRTIVLDKSWLTLTGPDKRHRGVLLTEPDEDGCDWTREYGGPIPHACDLLPSG